ncbi:hypothetical protein JA9_001961 [Meyerozyma sp. JA9]|nr:hypothetical protein JA9_001961 [Meyerozyma sp. JA9]
MMMQAYAESLNTSLKNAQVLEISGRQQTTLISFTQDTCMLCTDSNAQWLDVYCHNAYVLHVDRPSQPKRVKFMRHFDKRKVYGRILKWGKAAIKR